MASWSVETWDLGWAIAVEDNLLCCAEKEVEILASSGRPDSSAEMRSAVH